MTCKHIWLIETNLGQQSKGICRLCHEVRLFYNSTDARETGYVPDSLTTGKAKRRKGVKA